MGNSRILKTNKESSGVNKKYLVTQDEGKWSQIFPLQYSAAGDIEQYQQNITVCLYV